MHTVIQLPDNLFFGTSIATCIMVLRRSKSDSGILFVDASSQCVKVTNSNKLTEENISRIVDAYAARSVEEHFSRLVPYEEIVAQGYNLSVGSYVEQEDKRERVDIAALNAEIAAIVEREAVLRREINEIIKDLEG